MPTSSFNKINGFVEHMAEGVHDWENDTLMLALSNTDPATDGVNASTAAAVLATVTEIAYTNLAENRQLTTTSSQTSGTETLAITDYTLTASGGALPTFRYVYLYNDTPTTPADPLIGYWDYGAGGVTLANGESLDIDFAVSTITVA